MNVADRRSGDSERVDEAATDRLQTVYEVMSDLVTFELPLGRWQDNS